MESQDKDIGIAKKIIGMLRMFFGGPGGALVVFGGLITLFHQLYLYFQWGGSEFLEIVNNTILLIVFFLAFAFVRRAAKYPLLPPRMKKAWRFFAFACLSYTIATALWGYFEVVTKTQPFPSWADPFYLGYYILMFIGLLLAAPENQKIEEKLKLALDAGIVTLGSAMLLWYFLLQPIAQADGDWLLKALSLAYPICDLVTVFVISVVLLRQSVPNIRRSLNLLLISVFTIFAADVVFGYQNLNGTYKSGTLADSLFTVSAFFTILAAHCQYLYSSLKTESPQSYREERSFVWLPYFAIAAGYGLLLTFVFENSDTVLSQLIVIAGILIFLVVLRQLIAISESVKGKKALEALQERFQGIYNSSKDAIVFADFDGTFIEVNDSFVSLVGYSREELLSGKNYKQLTPVEYHQMNSDFLRKSIELDQLIEFEKEYLRKDGIRVPVSVSSFAVKGNDGKPMGLAAIIRDITERKRSEQQLRHNALHDALTDLPNRTLFLEYLRAAINRNSRRGDGNFAVLFLDFDRFKVINDSLGHLEGDKLLISIAQRLKTSLRSSDIVARLGGDEFTVMLDGYDNQDDVLRIVERIEDSLKEPFLLTEREIFISASIGVALSNNCYTKPDEMLRDADTAMYYAKAAGKARYQFFTSEMHEHAISRLRLENEMRPALERGEFRILYQPIIELETNRVIGFESLARWQHPERGLISPDAFIPIAEETGFIVKLGEWILRESCQQLRRWQKQNPSFSEWMISVNLSSKQFIQIDLTDTISKILRETKLNPEYLHLEVTESNIMKDSRAAIEIISSLQSLGVKISIDDFGTGYSSLSYLHHLPINSLKIDRSFVGEMSNHHKNAEIVRTILRLAESLGIQVIAEGVENTEQLEHLKQLGCLNGQGYLFSAPLSTRQVKDWLNTKYFTDSHDENDRALKTHMLNQLTINNV